MPTIEHTKELLRRHKAQGNKTRPVWIDDEGRLRIGRTADMIEMLERIGYRTRA